MKMNTFLKSTLAAALCIGLGSFTYNAVAQSITGGGGGGANSGVAPGIAYYATNGTTVSDGTVAAVKAGTLALGGATIGSNALAVTGNSLFNNSIAVSGGISASRSPAVSQAAQVFDGTMQAGGTGTTNFPHLFIQPSGTTAATTWSTAGTGLGMNLASGFAGNFLDFKTAGGATSLFKVDFGGNTTAGSGTFGGNVVMNNNGSVYALRAGGTILSSPASASIQLGSADVDTAPVAQTLRSQGALTGGTNNVAGADWTFIASPGKGTGAGGRFLFQTAAAGSSGNTQNTPVTALTISSTGLATFSNSIVAGAGNSIAWSGLSIMRSSADGSIVLLNQATTGFTSLQFGGLTSSFPSIKRTTTALNIRLADDSADAALTASNLTLSGLSASSAVCTDGSKVLTTSGCSSGGNTTMTSGTFTPTVVGNGTAGTTTYVTQTGRYRKFTTGSVTQWSIDIYVRGTLDGAATGNVVIGGLPFTVNASSVSSCSVSEAQSITFGAGYTQLGVEVVPSSTTLILNVMGTATTFANVPVANWGSNAFVKISCAIDE